MRIAIAADHGGYALKEHLIRRLQAGGHDVIDYGTHDERPVDYADVGRPAALAVAHGKADRAILIDTVGLAMAMVANRVKFVRAAPCQDILAAESARAHNDANVLCLGGRTIGPLTADRIVDVFLTTPFEGGRHQRRIDKLED